jgi:hypothetical protein
MHEVHPFRKAHPHSKLLSIESLLYLGFVIFLFMLVGYATNASPGAVLLGFAPAIAFGIILLLLVQTDHFNPAYNWFVMIGVLAIGAVAYVLLPVGAGMDIGTIILLNALLMTVALAVLHSSYVHEQPIVTHDAPVLHDEPVVETTQHHVVHHVHTPVEATIKVAPQKPLSEVIHSIEDKVKALNFVIGRVYSVYHGGTEHLRNKIRIDKTWYDTFNQIDEADTDKKRLEAIALVQKISDRLTLLKRSEREIFGSDVERLKNIQHDVQGNDAVIDVLVRNDKDPVQQYYDGAQTFCEEVLRSLRT